MMKEYGFDNKDDFSIDEFKEMMMKVGGELNDHVCSNELSVYGSDFLISLRKFKGTRNHDPRSRY